MKKNVGSMDTIIRVVIAIALAAVAFMMDVGRTGQIVLLAAAAIALLTGIVGYCPLYRLIGVRTCKLKQG
ncbi:MAG: DUF2892 domain-containing protein [Phycisphaerales bacterium]